MQAVFGVFELFAQFAQGRGFVGQAIAQGGHVRTEVGQLLASGVQGAPEALGHFTAGDVVELVAEGLDEGDVLFQGGPGLLGALGEVVHVAAQTGDAGQDGADFPGVRGCGLPQGQPGPLAQQALQFGARSGDFDVAPGLEGFQPAAHDLALLVQGAQDQGPRLVAVADGRRAGGPRPGRESQQQPDGNENAFYGHIRPDTDLPGPCPWGPFSVFAPFVPARAHGPFDLAAHAHEQVEFVALEAHPVDEAAHGQHPVVRVVGF